MSTVQREVSARERPEIRLDSRHRYFVTPPGGEEDPKPYPSVTTIISAVVPKQLSWWGMKVGCEGVEALAETGFLDEFITDEGLLIPQGTLVELLKKHKLTVNHIFKDAGNRGARIHGLLEHYARTGDIVPLKEFPPEYHPYIKALAQWLLDEEPEFLCMERATCSFEDRYAGTLDLKCRFKDNRVGLIDLKTSSGVYEDSYFPQLCAYEKAEIELGEDPTDFQAILHIDGKGGPAKLHENTYSYEDFRLMLALYRRIQSR